jgi:hypothetical protein
MIGQHLSPSSQMKPPKDEKHLPKPVFIALRMGL